MLLNSGDPKQGLILENLSVWLGNQTIFSNLNLKVGPTEMVVIVGPSGCGKTTLLRAIAGLVNVDSGRVILNGNEITQRDPADRNIGMVFQDHALYPNRTVLGNIDFPLRMRQVSKVERRAKAFEIAARLGIGHLIDRRPIEISGGERQRVALGRALVRDPSIFLFDEPLNSVDAAMQEDLQSLLLEVQRRTAVPTLYVTHNQVEAWRIADRIGVMRNGVILQIGTPSELYELPTSRFVAEFVGDVPMNIIPIEKLLGIDQEALVSRWPEGTELGIHMEDVVVVPLEELDRARSWDQLLIPVTAHHIERLGGRLILVTTATGKRIRALLTQRDSPVSGEKVALKMNLRDIYLFSNNGDLLKSRGVIQYT